MFAGPSCQLAENVVFDLPVSVPTVQRAEPPPAAEPSPSLPSVAPSACARAAFWANGFQWGPFFISGLFSKGVQTGWGRRCKRHKDAGSTTICQRPLAYRGKGRSDPVLDDADCIRQLKRWLIMGMAIGRNDCDCRTQHLALEIRADEDLSVELVER